MGESQTSGRLTPLSSGVSQPHPECLVPNARRRVPQVGLYGLSDVCSQRFVRP